MTLLTLIYTSGTPGPTKRVELTHANVMATVAGATERLRFTPGMRAISWLPMAHIAERLCANYVAITHGWQVTTCADPRAVGALLPEVRPQFLWTRHLPREVRTVEVAANDGRRAGGPGDRRLDAAGAPGNSRKTYDDGSPCARGCCAPML